MADTAQVGSRRSQAQRRRRAPAKAGQSGYCTWQTFWAIKLVNARIPTCCCPGKRHLRILPPPHQARQNACHVGRVQVGQKTHHTVAFGRQQSGNERIRVGNLARDWNIIAAIPNSFNTASLDLCQPVCNGFEADTTNPFSLQVKGNRRSTEVISYLSNDSLAILTLSDGLISLSMPYRTQPVSLFRGGFPNGFYST